VVLDAYPRAIPWSSWRMRHALSDRAPRRVTKVIYRRAIGAQPSLGKDPRFPDAGKMEEAREWAAELVSLLRAHDLLT
jgi:hypothetical protein